MTQVRGRANSKWGFTILRSPCCSPSTPSTTMCDPSWRPAIFRRPSHRADTSPVPSDRTTSRAWKPWTGRMVIRLTAPATRTRVRRRTSAIRIVPGMSSAQSRSSSWRRSSSVCLRRSRRRPKNPTWPGLRFSGGPLGDAGDLFGLRQPALRAHIGLGGNGALGPPDHQVHLAGLRIPDG